MPGNQPSRRQPEPAFYLDETFPSQVGEALASVGYAVIVPKDADKVGAKDPELIPWLAQSGLAWITKDDGARIRHRKELLTGNVSVVWVRGIDRSKSHITPKQLHFLLTNKLDEIARQLRSARGAIYFLLFFNGDKASLRSTRDITAFGSLAIRE